MMCSETSTFHNPDIFSCYMIWNLESNPKVPGDYFGTEEYGL